MKATRSAAPVTSLLQLQTWLFEQVTRAVPDGRSAAGARGAGAAAAGASAAGPDTGRDAELSQRVVSGSLSAAARVEVYRHGYFARLVECLEDDYPALAHALGAQRFEALCRDFILRHPPASASLNYYGAPFAAYCAQRRESWSAFAADLARLEWALVEAIHAEEGERLDIQALGRLSPEQWSTARLVASPAVRLLFATYPVEEFYRAWKEGSAAALAIEPNDSQPNDRQPNDRQPNDSRLPVPLASAVVVCRRGEDVWRIRLSIPLGRLLESLIAGAPLLEALERFGSGATAADDASAGDDAAGDDAAGDDAAGDDAAGDDAAGDDAAGDDAAGDDAAGDDAAGDDATSNQAAIEPEELQRAFQDWVSCGLFSSVALD